jgi:HK97 family phage portal protein
LSFLTRSRNRAEKRADIPQPLPYITTQPDWSSLFAAVTLPEVTDKSVRGLPAAWRCVNLIANGVASMSPLSVYAGDDITKRTVPPVISRPVPNINTFDFWHSAVSTALMWGNFVALLADFDAEGVPQQTVPVHPSYVQCLYDADGYTTYLIEGEVYSSDQVLHVLGYRIPGVPWGIGVVDNFRRSMGQAIDQQSMAADTYRSGSVPSGVITVDKTQMTNTQAGDIQSQWITGHGGGLRRPAVLPQGWKFDALTWSPEDAQFLQARQFTVAETAFMFGLDPSDLGATVGGQGQTYANIEQRQIQRVTESYGPWMRRFEEAYSDLLPGDLHAVFNVENLLRTDSKTRAEVHQINIGTGVETVTEARADEHKPPAPPEPEPAVAPAVAGAPAVPGAPGAPVAIPGTHITVTDPKVKL